VEARAYHADAILLIAAALTDGELKRFARSARQLALDVLVEVHTAAELDRVLDSLGEAGADAIGVNNRDLKTFAVRLTPRWSWPNAFRKRRARAESGISTADDLAHLRRRDLTPSSSARA